MGKHIPLRMCVGCRQMLPKDQLIRMVKDKETGSIIFDDALKLPGRGVYLCKNQACVDAAKKKKGLQRQFKAMVPDEIYERAKEKWTGF